MVKSYLKRKKVLAAGMAAALVASAFQPASCNLNISPEMLGDLVEAVGGFSGGFGGGFEGGFGDGEYPEWPEDGEYGCDDHGGDDGHDGHESDSL